jgi:hypothetical protein
LRGRLKLDLCEIHKALPKDAKIIATVHNEIIVEASEAKAEQFKKGLPAAERVWKDGSLAYKITRISLVPFTGRSFNHRSQFHHTKS